LNEELRNLVEEERSAYAEEKKENEDCMKRMEKNHEAKLKLIRNKLVA